MYNAENEEKTNRPPNCSGKFDVYYFLDMHLLPQTWWVEGKMRLLMTLFSALLPLCEILTNPLQSETCEN